MVFRSVLWRSNLALEKDKKYESVTKVSVSHRESSENKLRHRRTLNGDVPESGYVGTGESIDPKIYIFGYLIEMAPETPSLMSNITLISCSSPVISSHLATFKFCAKLKSFVEELVSLSSSLSIQESKELRKLDAQGPRIDKLKSYFGYTANLMRNYSFMKSRELNQEESDGSDDESVYSSKVNVIDSASEINDTTTSFDYENYVDITVNSREILKIPIDYTLKTEKGQVKFNWEFMSVTELPIFFGIEFIPSDGFLSTLYEKTDCGSWIIFPFSCILAYSKPAFGKLLIDDFPAGKFVVTFDNLSTTKSAIRRLTTRCWISYTCSPSIDILMNELYQRPLSECHFEFIIPRKAILAVPIPFDCIFTNSQIPEKIQLNWSGTIEGGDIFFSIFAQEKVNESFSQSENVDEFQEIKNSSIGSNESIMGVISNKVKNENKGEISKAKISKFIGKAKEVYKEVKTVVNQPRYIPTSDVSLKSSISSRINAVVVKSEMASRKILQVMTSDSSQDLDTLFLESSPFIRNHPNLKTIFPHCKLNSIEQPFKGTLEISKKPGIYFLLFENSQVLSAPKQITCAISIN